jgi:hypothetical protein
MVNAFAALAATAALAIAGAAVAQSSAPRAPSEVMQTVTADVIISDARHRGPDGMYPEPAAVRAKSDYPGRICMAAIERFADPAAPSGWKIETLLLEAAGARLDQPLETQRQLIARWWAATDLGCAYLSRQERAVLPMMLGTDMESYRIVDRIVLKYALPLNDVASDGRTVLDVLAERYDELPADQRKNTTKRIYGTLRRFGAKHRMELEREGTIPDAPQLMAAWVARLTAAADGGDAGAALQLARNFQRHPHLTPDLAKSTAWLAKAEALAVANRDGPILGALGDSYLDALRDVQHTPSMAQRAPFTGKRERAVQLLELALTAKYPPESRALEEAQADLGYAYYIGFGTPQNWDRALTLLMPLTNDVFAQHRVGQMLLERGRRAEAIRHLRTVAFSSMHSLPFQGTTVGQWLQTQPEGLCGPGPVDIVYDGC